MKNLAIVLITSVFFFNPALSAGAEPDDFEVNSTRDLIDLCTVAPDDPLYGHAIHFCHGFLEGAVHYHDAMSRGPNGRRLFCFPDEGPSRNEAIAMFIDWARERPQYMEEPAVETEFRFLIETWPCK